MTDRPKESYLAWFREILLNYKAIGMIILVLGGYSITNLYDDLGFNVPLKAPQEPEETWEPIGNQSVPEASQEHDQPPAQNYDMSQIRDEIASQIASHLEKSHIKDHRELHQ